MEYREAARCIEDHMKIHRLQEGARATKITEALNLAITILLENDKCSSNGEQSHWVVRYPDDGKHDMYQECPYCGCEETDFLAQYCRCCGAKMSTK